VNFNHVLVFGGTGMLAQTTGWIAEHAKHTVAFGRNKQRLNGLAKKYGQYGLEARELDYTNTEALRKAIKVTYTEYGKIDLVVSWIHSTAPDAIPEIKKQLSKLQKNHQWTLVVVKGSSSHLARITDSEMDIPDNCFLKEVQLGFKYNGVSSRWLTHQEISEGVIKAIREDKKNSVVGTLEPWEKRP
jgi:NAD(P)-dependent dehydrogenase (short-subunit alcohol dehydrogenase family)